MEVLDWVLTVYFPLAIEVAFCNYKAICRFLYLLLFPFPSAFVLAQPIPISPLNRAPLLSCVIPSEFRPFQ